MFFEKNFLHYRILFGDPQLEEISKNIDFSLRGKQCIVLTKWTFFPHFSSLCGQMLLQSYTVPTKHDRLHYCIYNNIIELLKALLLCCFDCISLPLILKRSSICSYKSQTQIYLQMHENAPREIMNFLTILLKLCCCLKERDYMQYCICPFNVLFKNIKKFTSKIFNSTW